MKFVTSCTLINVPLKINLFPSKDVKLLWILHLKEAMLSTCKIDKFPELNPKKEEV